MAVKRLAALSRWAGSLRGTSSLSGKQQFPLPFTNREVTKYYGKLRNM
jgi:hypothetical protein